MSIIKSFSVGEGDMFYIKHNSSNFSIIDCCLDDDNKEEIVDEIISEFSGGVSCHAPAFLYAKNGVVIKIPPLT